MPLIRKVHSHVSSSSIFHLKQIYFQRYTCGIASMNIPGFMCSSSTPIPRSNKSVPFIFARFLSSLLFAWGSSMLVNIKTRFWPSLYGQLANMFEHDLRMKFEICTLIKKYYINF